MYMYKFPAVTKHEAVSIEKPLSSNVYKQNLSYLMFFAKYAGTNICYQTRFRANLLKVLVPIKTITIKMYRTAKGTNYYLSNYMYFSYRT